MPTGDTPFRLAFRTGVVIPVEMGLTSLRTQRYNLDKNEEGLKLSSNLLEERRDEADMVIASYR